MCSRGLFGLPPGIASHSLKGIFDRAGYRYLISKEIQMRTASAGKEGGFTLLEVMVAVMIMALLAMAAAPNIREEINSRRTELTVQETQLILDAVRSFRIDTGSWPGGATCLTAINALTTASPAYLVGVTNINKFNQSLSTSCTAQTFSIAQTLVPDWDSVVANRLPGTTLSATPANSIISTIGIPGTEAALDGKLSRVATGNAELNRMRTNLLLGNNNISEVAGISAQSLALTGNASAASANISGAVTAGSAAVSGAVTAASASVTGRVNAGSAVIAGDIDAASGTIRTFDATTATVTGGTNLQSTLVVGGTSQFNSRATFAQEIQLSRVVTEGAGCAGNGMIARNAAGKLLSCESGTWQAGGGISSCTRVTGTDSGSGDLYATATCPAGRLLTGVACRSADSSNNTIQYDANPKNINNTSLTCSREGAGGSAVITATAICCQ